MTHRDMGTWDVVVCGGGPAGCAAAVAARRAGRSVLLLEGQGQLGGMGTSGLVSHWLGGRTHDGRWVAGGLFREWAQDAAARGIALLPHSDPAVPFTPHGWVGGLVHGVPFDPFAMAAYLDGQVTGAGVEVLFFSQVVDAETKGDRIERVLVANKAGVGAVRGRVFIDATGDADLAARSGCQVVAGREGDHLMAAATLMFHVDNVDQKALAAYIGEHNSPRFKAEILRLRERGEWPFPYEIFISVQLQEKGVMMINTSRLCDVDGTDPRSISDGMRRGRTETQQLLAVMRRHFPGFARARLKAVAPLLGVRETRRLLGEYVLTVAEVSGGTGFPDTIGFSAYGWDLPDPKRPSYQPMHEAKVAKPSVTPIPYRILLPRPVTNLICPGRAVSVEREVLGPLRVMAPCMVMGQAAGVAAAQASARAAVMADVEIPGLQAALREAGAILEWPPREVPP